MMYSTVQRCVPANKTAYNRFTFRFQYVPGIWSSITYMAGGTVPLITNLRLKLCPLTSLHSLSLRSSVTLEQAALIYELPQDSA